MVAIKTSGLTREFGDLRAVDGLDFEVKSGEVYGFLGPNGAGKSTTINMLLNFTPPTSGSGSVLGHDIERESKAIRQSTGVLPEDFGVYKRLTARKHVQFAIDVKGADDDPDVLLERVGLEDDADRKAGGFSTGMKQRLALAMALVDDPDLLILDEPSSGLDPNGAREMRAIIREEVDRGATVFFSSHVMGQVEAICDRVGIMRDGAIIVEDTIDALKETVDADTKLVVTVDDATEEVREAILAVDGVTDAEIDGHDIVVALTDSSQKTTVLGAIESNGTQIDDITSVEASLEDLFAAITTDDGPVIGDGQDAGDAPTPDDEADDSGVASA